MTAATDLLSFGKNLKSADLTVPKDVLLAKKYPADSENLLIFRILLLPGCKVIKLPSSNRISNARMV